MSSDKHTPPAGLGQVKRQHVVQDGEPGADQPPPQDDVAEAIPDHFKVTKAFPPRGEWRLYRLATSTEFSCCRCRKTKKSKLVAIKEGNWGQLWCNGCYGELLASDATPGS